MIRLLTLSLALTASTAAYALEDGRCVMDDGEVIPPMTNAEFIRYMDQADASLTELNLNDARYILEVLYAKMRCLSEPARPTDIVRFARQQGTISFFDQDETNAIRWMLLAKDTVPDQPWPVAYPPTHPLRGVLEWAEEPATVGPADMRVLPPKKGAILMNGYLLTLPNAKAEVPNLVQVFDKRGELVKAFWQDGGAFRPEYLAPEDGTEVQPPKWFVPYDVDTAVAAMRADPAFRVDDEIAVTDDDDGIEIVIPGVTDATDGTATTDGTDGDGATADGSELTVPPPPTVKPPRSGPRLAQLGAGAGAVVVAGVLLGAAYGKQASLSNATSAEELTAARSGANRLVVGSGILGVAAVGIGATAFIRAETVGVGVDTRW